MKLKNILIGIGLITSLQGVQSCIDDRGNYSYISNEELLPVTISGFEDTTVIIRSTLNITPVLENMDDESRYIHLWYAAPSVTAGFTPQRDTLSLEKDLSFEVTYESGTYNLVYELRDPKLDHRFWTRTVKRETGKNGISVFPLYSRDSESGWNNDSVE